MTQLSASVWSRPSDIPSSPATTRAAAKATEPPAGEAPAEEEATAVAAKKTELLNV